MVFMCRRGREWWCVVWWLTGFCGGCKFRRRAAGVVTRYLYLLLKLLGDGRICMWLDGFGSDVVLEGYRRS